MAASGYVLVVNAAMNDEVVDGAVVLPGRPAQIGRTALLSVPVPDEVAYICKVSWAGPSKVMVIDGLGDTYELAPGQELRIHVGPLTVSLWLNERLLLRRTESVSWRGSMAWLALVLLASLLTQQSAILYTNRCEWFALTPELWVALRCPVETQVASNNSVQSDYLAEYMARLLRKDFEGRDEGEFLPHKPRPKAPKLDESFFLPAGNDGPITEMGGAEDVGPEPIRTPPKEEKIPSTGGEEEVKVEPVESGTPMEEQEEAPGPDADGVIEDAEEEDAVAEEVPVEEVEGWGLPDWYDAEDQLRESFETDFMKNMARRELAIDPDSAEALSILSYYQYLSEDFDAAAETYDKYIRLFPDETAGYNNKALIHKRKGQYEEEERLYRVALAIDPGDVTALNNLAVCLSHQGRHEEALAIMKQLEVLDPGEPYADLHRAKIYAEMGDNESAFRFLEKSLQGMKELDTLHHIEFRQDIRVDPSFRRLRQTQRFHALLVRYYGKDAPVEQ